MKILRKPKPKSGLKVKDYEKAKQKLSKHKTKFGESSSQIRKLERDARLKNAAKSNAYVALNLLQRGHTFNVVPALQKKFTNKQIAKALVKKGINNPEKMYDFLERTANHIVDVEKLMVRKKGTLPNIEFVDIDTKKIKQAAEFFKEAGGTLESYVNISTKMFDLRNSYDLRFKKTNNNNYLANFVFLSEIVKDKITLGTLLNKVHTKAGVVPSVGLTQYTILEGIKNSKVKFNKKDTAVFVLNYYGLKPKNTPTLDVMMYMQKLVSSGKFTYIKPQELISALNYVGFNKPDQLNSALKHVGINEKDRLKILKKHPSF